MLRRWLRIRFSESDVECPFCDGMLDGYGDHALVCCAGGDRTRRHNLLRNMVFHAAEAANLRPEAQAVSLKNLAFFLEDPCWVPLTTMVAPAASKTPGLERGALLTCISLGGGWVRWPPGILMEER